MKEFKRMAALILALTLVFTMLLAGCGGQATNEQTTKGGETSQPTTTKAVKEETIKMTMFMSNSGIAIPEGVDASNNEWINIVEKIANVDLEIEVPNYNDFKTKFTLLLASGNLPDIVHSNFDVEATASADHGAFIDLKKYYDKSPVVQKQIPADMMEAAKSESGHYFRIPMAYNHAPVAGGVYGRWDLVKKYNNNKWPETVDEWITLFRTMHKAEPESIVIANRAVGDKILGFGGLPVYYWYGAHPYEARYEYDTGKVVSNFVLPEFKAATAVMKQLYDEGILDKEFATTDTEKYKAKKLNNNVLLQYGGLDQALPYVMVNDKLGKTDPKTVTWEYGVAPPLTKYPAELKDPKYAVPFTGLPISTHGLYIASSSKNQHRAWRVIEGFASDELYQLIFWGKEGSEYKVENGVRIPDAEKLSSKTRNWSLQLALIFGFTNGQDVKRATAEAGLGKEFSDGVYKSIGLTDTLARKKGVNPVNISFQSDAAKAKMAEVRSYISQVTVEAIMGKITMAQYDQKVTEFEKKYGFIYEEYAKYIADNKAKLEQKGVNFSY